MIKGELMLVVKNTDMPFGALQASDRVIKLDEVRTITGQAGDFPKRFKISKRSIAWSLKEIDQWVNSRKSQ
jgi:predicted DNA-binding transcriptional regulator AlpA